jgi:inward rectifier potassium channel
LTARVAFSEVATIAPHEAVPTLSFRTANQRSNQILEAQLKVYLMRDEVTPEEQYIRRIHDLPLVRNQSPSFALSWLALHPIDESSPLSGVTPEALVETNSTIVVTLSGVDEIVTQNMCPSCLCSSRYSVELSLCGFGVQSARWRSLHGLQTLP